MNFMVLGDTIARYRVAQSLYIADDGVAESRRNSEAPIEHNSNPTVKISGVGTPSLRIDWARRERFRTSPVTVKRTVSWSIMIV